MISMIHSAKRLSGILLENGCDKTSLPFARTQKRLNFSVGSFLFLFYLCAKVI